MALVSFAGLRVRLVLADLLALGLTLSSGLRQRGEATHQAKMRALETVREASSFHKRMIDDARQTLFTVLTHSGCPGGTNEQVDDRSHSGG